MFDVIRNFTTTTTLGLALGVSFSLAQAQNSSPTTADAPGGASSSTSSIADFFSKLKDKVHVVSNPGNVNSSVSESTHSFSEAANWDVLGIKIGTDFDSVAAIVRKTYPAGKQLSLPIGIKYRLFQAPEGIYGSEFIAGHALSGQQTRPQVAGNGELGDQSDRLDIEYVWPVKGRVVAIRRIHDYGTMHSTNLPTLETLKAALVEKYGEPNYSHFDESTDEAHEGTGMWGVGTRGRSVAIWVWRTVSPQSRSAARQICATSDPNIWQYSITKTLNIQVKPIEKCGVELEVSVAYFKMGEATNVLSMSTNLVDYAAFGNAQNSLYDYLQAHSSETSNQDQQNRASIRPTL